MKGGGGRRRRRRRGRMRRRRQRLRRGGTSSSLSYPPEEEEEEEEENSSIKKTVAAGRKEKVFSPLLRRHAIEREAPRQIPPPSLAPKNRPDEKERFTRQVSEAAPPEKEDDYKYCTVRRGRIHSSPLYVGFLSAGCKAREKLKAHSYYLASAKKPLSIFLSLQCF